MEFETIFEFLHSEGIQFEDIIVLESENQLVFRNKNNNTFLFTADKAVNKECRIFVSISKNGYKIVSKIADFF